MDEYTFADVDFAVEVEFDEMFSEESDDFTEYEYEDYDGYEDAGMEGYLFGWDSQSLPAQAHFNPFVKFTITLKSPLKLSALYGMVNL